MLHTLLRRGPEPMERITANISRFPAETFYGEAVGVYLVEDGNKNTLIEVPTFSDRNRATVNDCRTNANSTAIYLTHGSTSPDGNKWQSEEGIQVNLHSADLNHAWLRCSPQGQFAGDFQISQHLQVIHLPGHSPGSCVYYDKRDGGTLFSGDALLFHRGKFEIEADPHILSRITELPFARLLPFHYEMILNAADLRLREVLARK